MCDRSSAYTVVESAIILIIIVFSFVSETGKVDPTPHTSSFNMGYLVSPYPYPNGAGGPIPVSMVSSPVMLFVVLFPSNLACLRLATSSLRRGGGSGRPRLFCSRRQRRARTASFVRASRSDLVGLFRVLLAGS